MYHPATWKRVNPNNYDVGGYQVQFHKGIWSCDCVAGTFKISGAVIRQCKHVRFVKRKEEEITKWQKEEQEH